jgi:bacterioferritin-associated ferredoxin
VTAAAAEHGYPRYARGCRCPVCREAKAAYMRDKRAQAAEARQEAPGEFVAPGITHGGIAGYKDSGCRCGPCRRAAKQASVRDKRAAAGGAR